MVVCGESMRLSKVFVDASEVAKRLPPDTENAFEVDAVDPALARTEGDGIEFDRFVPLDGNGTDSDIGKEEVLRHLLKNGLQALRLHESERGVGIGDPHVKKEPNDKS